ncbi:hypothetical protein BC939DRAFT_437444 [Gamsiella multidivaricata]|uniref:uncharacterized protein n=1 Tax=Gamsiella multidivaricata TaxID=101098 RepID=UPI00221EC5BC|nr:uncharacterized protein BC939DRAFT_437444 [Gamsiella multidivaricata]KAI7831567.1 hypothetical protein BC939DRAFT_437444 [Gamsiella multidivaricata]
MYPRMFVPSPLYASFHEKEPRAIDQPSGPSEIGDSMAAPRSSLPVLHHQHRRRESSLWKPRYKRL